MPELGSDTVIDGRYSVLRRLGSGGMADVYCAEDAQLGRKVAVKVLHQRFAADEEFVERFKREAQSAAGLQHPNVVGIYDRGTWDGTSYIAMEFLDGQNLKEVIREEAPLDPLRAVDVGTQILKAARFAHKRGIIHRDLKPHNVIVDADGRVKVTDFGIARAGASDMTETGSIMGTAQYLSPEQAQGHAVSARSDLYSVGVILYELLTGRLPFEAESAVSIALKHVTEAPVPLRRLNPAVPPELETLVLWALEKEPERRPPDADAFLAALEDVRGKLAAEERGAATTAFAPVPVPVPLDDPADGTAVAPVPVPLVADEEPLAAAEPLEEEDRRNRKRIVLLALLLLLLLAGAALAYFLTRPEQLAVPNEVGQTLTVAQTRLQNQGFRVEVIKRTSDRPRDQVIGQAPTPGEKIDKGETVTLTVSDGPGQAVVPEVAGLSETRAVRAVRRAGFRPRVTRRNSDTVAVGTAIETSPEANSQLDKGRRVTVVVSSGRAKVTVPDVTGQDRASARSTLEDAGFSVTERTQESSQSPGTVLAQSPGGGASVDKGASVSIVVAKKAPDQPVSVPDVTGKSQQAATNALSGAGFRVVVHTRKTTKQDEDGKVLAQSPGGSAKAKKGSAVTIAVGSFEPDVQPNEQNDTTTTTTPTTTTP